MLAAVVVSAINIKGLLELTNETMAKDPDSLVRVLPYVDKAISKAKPSADRALLMTVKAELLEVIYQSNRWVYDKLDTPDEPLPTDVTEWNGRQFVKEIGDLSVRAFELGAADERPLSDYGDIITSDRQNRRFFPTVGSFVALKAVENLHSVGQTKMSEELVAQYVKLCRPKTREWFFWESALRNGDELRAFYEENKDCEASGLVLDRLAGEYYEYDEESAWVVDALKDFIKRYPAYEEINNLRNHLERLTQAQVTIACRSTVCPGVPFDVKIGYRFAGDVKINLYKIPESCYEKRNLNTQTAKAVQSITLSPGNDVVKGDTAVVMTVGESGCYALAAELEEQQRSDVIYLLSTYVITGEVKGREKEVLISAEYVSGKPVEKPVVKPRTDRVRAYDDGLNYQVRLMTERPLYHRGDTIRWAVVVGTYEKESAAHCIEGAKLRVILNDVNFQGVDTVYVATDEYGRVSGSFVAPEDGLTGQYGIEVAMLTGGGYRYMDTENVTVSDFKMPSFRVENVSVERNEPTAGEVTLKGVAKTYSGMAVSGAKTEIEIWSATRWRWFSQNRRLTTLEGTTDAEGMFKIVVPAEIVSQSKNFIAKISVTSAAGETQQYKKYFTTGKNVEIVARGGDIVADNSKPIEIDIEAYNAEGEKVGINVELRISREDADGAKTDTVMTHTAMSNRKEAMDLSSLAAGRYVISVAPVDTTLADVCQRWAGLTLYNVGLNEVPDGEVLFVPQMQYESENGKFEVLIGIPKEKAYVYEAICSRGELLSMEVEELSRGFKKVGINMPEGADAVTMKLWTVFDGDIITKDITLKKILKKKIKIEASSIRDRVTPGAEERWIFRLEDEDGQGLKGAMIATMFNAALNSIVPYSLPWRFGFKMHYGGVNLESKYLRGLSYGRSYGKVVRYDALRMELPKFNPEITYFRTMTTGRRYAAMNKMAVADMASSRDGGMIGAVLLEDSEAESAEESVAAGEAERPTSDDFEYRDSEVLEAFWRPELTFDEKDGINISFKVPNANTTWALNCFGWTTDLRLATFVKELVANKPVMVTPNYPRFLRSGDRAELLATVYNNSDSTANVETVIEIYDVNNGKVIMTGLTRDSIAANGRAVVAIMVTAPDDVSAVGYRIRSTAGRFTDGEDGLIAIEPSRSDVTESVSFYLNAENDGISCDIPQGDAVLDFTSNPAWNIIKELPTLAKENLTTSTGAMNVLYGAAVARGMLDRFPELANVIRTWSEQESNSALVSRLSQNDGLKVAALSETPWVEAASDDTQRMARLSLLFDKKETERNIERSISVLAKLQQSDGGWCWGDWNKESSPWVSGRILVGIGCLKMAGYMPEDKTLKDMTSSAMAYYESKIDKRTDFDLTLAYIAALHQDVELSLRGKQIVSATHQRMIKNWKSEPTSQKALIALVLYRAGYKAVAAEIVKAISKLATVSRDQGASFATVKDVDDYAELLTVFAMTDPESSLIDGMRQWLVMRQQLTMMLGSYNPINIISAFVASGSGWLDSDDTRISISAGDDLLQPDSIEYATGHMVCRLPQEAAGRKLTIEREGRPCPSYGSIVTRYNAASSEVKSSRSNDLSIEKRLMVMVGGEWRYANEAKVGDKVRILYTIKSKRDMEYVTLVDERAAALEPVDQTPGWRFDGGVGYYRENRDTSSNLFFNYLPRGTHHATIDCVVEMSGDFVSGVATIQSQLSPGMVAHSCGGEIHVAKIR